MRQPHYAFIASIAAAAVFAFCLVAAIFQLIAIPRDAFLNMQQGLHCAYYLMNKRSKWMCVDGAFGQSTEYWLLLLVANLLSLKWLQRQDPLGRFWPLLTAELAVIFGGTAFFRLFHFLSGYASSSYAVWAIPAGLLAAFLGFVYGKASICPVASLWPSDPDRTKRLNESIDVEIEERKREQTQNVNPNA